MSGVQSIERAFGILRVLSRGPAGVTEVADEADLPKSTVSRLLAALEAEGAVEQTEIGGDYVLGETLTSLAAAAAPVRTLGAVIRPFIEELSRSTGGSAGFTIRRGDEMYWVDNVDDPDALVHVSDQTGQAFAMHTVPSGLAVLAQLDADDVEAYLYGATRRADPLTPTQRSAARRRLEGVGDDRVLISYEDLDPGVNAIAAPFRGPDGTWQGAVYLQGPSFRFPDDGDDDRVRKLVVVAAETISERLELH